ncbi:response regulator [Candidatus Poribacteria bacterium]
MKRLLKILLADNKEVIHQTLADYLSDSGHSVDRVHDESSTLTAIEEHDYDLTLIDLRMPGMDSPSLLSNIREIRSNIPVVVMAGYEDMDVVLQALKLGATDYLTKPVKLLELDAVLEKSVRMHKLMSQHTQDTDTPQIDHDEPKERKKVKDTKFFVLLTATCLFVFLFLIHGAFMGGKNAAKPVTAEELQNEISERKLTEAALQESEWRYHLLSENVTDVVWITDMDMRFTYINPAITRLTGYNVAEAMALSWEELWHPECFGSIKEIFVKEMAGEDIDQKDVNGLRTAKVRLICRDGSAMWVEVKCTSLGKPGEQPVGLLVILREFTEGKQAARPRDWQQAL